MSQRFDGQVERGARLALDEGVRQVRRARRGANRVLAQSAARGKRDGAGSRLRRVWRS